MLKKVILKLIRLYQKTSFFHGYIARVLFLTDKVCRFIPRLVQPLFNKNVKIDKSS